MSIADELSKLEQLRDRGTLSAQEFEQAKARVLQGGSATPSEPVQMFNRLRRSRTDKWIGGVCGGLALTTGMESWVLRLIFAVLLLCWGTGLIVYLLLWVFVPEQ